MELFIFKTYTLEHIATIIGNSEKELEEAMNKYYPQAKYSACFRLDKKYRRKDAIIINLIKETIK